MTAVCDPHVAEGGRGVRWSTVEASLLFLHAPREAHQSKKVSQEYPPATPWVTGTQYHSI